MQALSKFNAQLKFLFTDIDDTLTDEGYLFPEAYSAIWNLYRHNIKVVPVTGRPAGWCEMIARQWPVAAVVGENGAFYFTYKNKTMHRHFFTDEKTRIHNQIELEKIRAEVLSKVTGCAVASDQFCRLFDLAIDFCEDVPALPKTSISKIVEIFQSHGAQAKVSSIHVNGWFGSYNKLTMVLEYLSREWNINKNEAKQHCGFSGDSPNDEPMFEYFPYSFGVANINNFLDELKHPPQFIAQNCGGAGFNQIAEQIITKSSI
jgi:HAD superfamily hydrolase (TIGR01484 family)